MDTYNLSAFDVTGSTENYQLAFSFNSTPKVSFGAAKLIARFTQLLFTEKGSDRTDPRAGCNLRSLVAQFHTSESEYLRREINDAIEDVSVQMLAENDPTVVKEAQFVSAVCEHLEIRRDTLYVRIKLITAEKKIIQFELPVSI